MRLVISPDSRGYLRRRWVEPATVVVPPLEGWHLVGMEKVSLAGARGRAAARGHPQAPQPVPRPHRRDGHAVPGGMAGAAVRGPHQGQQHPQLLGRAVVGHRDGDHRRLRRPVPGQRRGPGGGGGPHAGRHRPDRRAHRHGGVGVRQRAHRRQQGGDQAGSRHAGPPAGRAERAPGRRRASARGQRRRGGRRWTRAPTSRPRPTDRSSPTLEHPPPEPGRREKIAACREPSPATARPRPATPEAIAAAIAGTDFFWLDLDVHDPGARRRRQGHVHRPVPLPPGGGRGRGALRPTPTHRRLRRLRPHRHLRDGRRRQARGRGALLPHRALHHQRPPRRLPGAGLGAGQDRRPSLGRRGRRPRWRSST